MTATLKYATTSDKKLTLIAKLVQWKKLSEAMVILKNLPKKGADILYKLVQSASANAKNNGDSKGELYIEKVDVTRWPKYKRYRFASRSRVHRYVKHRSFVRVVLGVK